MSHSYMGGPPINAFMKVPPSNNEEGYEINPILVDMLHTKQYKGDGTEDLYTHIDFFEDICGTFKLNAFTNDEMRLKIFSQTLTDKAISWYKSHPKGMFDSWDKLFVAFLLYFYRERKSNEARRVITNFGNRPGESLLNGYVRFRELPDYCPHPDLRRM